MRNTKVTIDVPATTANLGPGFDCLGLALDIWNRVTIGISEQPNVEITGEGEGQLSHGTNNLVYRAASGLLEGVAPKPLSLSIQCHNSIPLARGLGSSAAAVVGGLLAANELFQNPYNQEELISMAEAMEGHADNVVPALLGGCQVVVKEDESLVNTQIPVPDDIQVVLFIPDVSMPTTKARALLSPKVSRQDAVYNVGRVAMLVAALATGRLEHLWIATKDKLHQPAREALLPQMPLLFKAALNAGALGVFLSGGGSTILALTKGKGQTIAYEMADMAYKTGLPGQTRITGPASTGARVVNLS